MLEVKKLRYNYEDQEFAYDLVACRGEITVVLGKSGSGKSTLLSLIAGFIAPENGDILFDGCSLLDIPTHLRPLSILFQENNLFSHLSLYDNIALGLSLDLKLDAQQKELLNLWAKELEISELLKRFPDEVSGGQKQRAALCRALVRKSPLLLLDEPFSALDKELKLSILELTKKLSQKENLCVLMVSHDEEDVARVGGKYIRIDGKD